jgi:hypothetical protein
MVLVDFFVPIAWPAVALFTLWVLRVELRAMVRKFGDSISKLVDRIIKAKIGSIVEVEAHVETLQGPQQIEIKVLHEPTDDQPKT